MADKKKVTQIYHFSADIKNVEIRKVEKIETSFDVNGKSIPVNYIQLTCDVGENMDRLILKDKDMGNSEKYKRGMFGTFTVRIDVEETFNSNSFKMLVTNFVEENE